MTPFRAPDGGRSLRAVVLAAALIATTASPVAAARTRPSLAGKTTVVASRPASIQVRVPAEATIETPFGATPDVKVEGGGDLVAFALVQEAADPFVLFGGRVPDGADGTEVALPLSNLPERTGWNFDFVKNYGDRTTVPPGNYRLYVFPGKGTARVSLELAGLRGSMTLSPRDAAAFHVDRPAPRLAAPGPAKNVYSAGSASELRSTGLIFNTLWLKTAPFVAGQFQFCHYEGEDPLDAGAYAPGCANAKQTSTTNNRRTATEASTRLLFGGKSSLPATRHGQGFWYTTEGVVEDIGYVSLWLSYS